MSTPSSTLTTIQQLWPAAADNTLLPQALLPRNTRIHAPLRWQRLGSTVTSPSHGSPSPDDVSDPHHEAVIWATRVELGASDEGVLWVPSLILGATAIEAYCMAFRWPDRALLPLSPIAVNADPASLERWPKGHMNRVASHAGAALGGLDCIETLTAVNGLSLQIEVRTAGPEPDAALLVGARPRRHAPTDDGGTAVALDLPPLSQKTRSPDIANHICSPVCIAMLLAARGIEIDPEPFARSCEHPHHGKLFGMWPLNLARASALGLSGMVRVFSSADEACALLASGVPIITSIRFGPDRLEGAPMAQTGGHLVVLRGMDERHAWVNDPAAPDDASVARRYDRGQFLQAWLADRGVGYVLWPHADSMLETR